MVVEKNIFQNFFPSPCPFYGLRKTWTRNMHKLLQIVKKTTTKKFKFNKQSLDHASVFYTSGIDGDSLTTIR